MAGELDWLRDSLRDIRDDIKEVRTSISKLHDKLDGHEKECPARKAFLKRPSVPPHVGSFLPLLIKLGPIILAAGLGLLGLGAYWGGNHAIERFEKQIQKRSVDK